jgi:uncharacterized protein (TIGR02246 family)
MSNCTRAAILIALATPPAVEAQTVMAQRPVSDQRTPTAVTPEIAAADWNAISQSAERYVAAFNAGDAEGIAKLYAENAELIDSGGNLFRGRAMIEKEYAAFFEAHPGGKMRIDVDTVRPITTTLVSEEGRTETILGGGQTAVVSRYSALHAKEQDVWRLVKVQDFEVDANDPGARLEQLAWLIGRWVDEDRESLLETDCYWHDSGAYLIREFRVQTKGLLAASGTERIGWDPLSGQIRSWLFDSKGGYLEGDWVRAGDTWTVTARGFRADGKPSRAMYVVTPLKKDAYHMASFHRFAGEERLEDLDMTIVRRPPAPPQVGDEAADATPQTNHDQ